MMNLLRIASIVLLATIASPAWSIDSGPASRDIVNSHLDAHNAHDIEGVLKTLADSVEMRVLNPNGGKEFHANVDRNQQRSQFETAFRVNPKSSFQIISEIVSPSTVIVYETGKGFPDGNSGHGITLYRVSNGKISAIWILDHDSK
jgi:hypothetical protein